MAGVAELRAGAFVLEELLGKGGSSDVWRARHASGAAAAVKVLRAELAGDRLLAEALRNEVLAVARLEHPSIALVLDFGEIDDDESRASEGALASGSPWLALELASGDTLASLRATTWTALRDTLSVLLGALAHAHARGFIHRDLKPANVLVCRENDPRPGLKLGDFGLARAFDVGELPAEGMLAGTPAYMSPEQFHLDDASLGPWSDLYALGCLAYALVTGRPPFEGSWQTLVRAHQGQERPTLPPLPGAPPALSAWLRRLLEPEPGARFPSAADARFALHALDDSDPPDPRLIPSGLSPSFIAAVPSLARTPPVRVLSEEEPTEGWRNDGGIATAPTRVRSTPRLDERDVGRAATASPPLALRTRTAGTSAPPLPSTWRMRWRDDGGAPRSSLLGAGLGLYGLREVPVSGRERERDAVWRALIEVSRDRNTRAVVLRGHAGAGKSRLASWLSSRAHEIGGVLSLRAEHDATLASTDPLARMVSRHLGLPAGADASETLEHARRWLRHRDLAESEAASIASLVQVDARDSAGVPSIERHARLRGLLRAISNDRPVLVWLDDVQWGHDAVRFGESLLGSDASVLLVLTAREEALIDPVVTAALSAFEEHDDVQRIDIGPLEDRDHRALVADLLHLAPDVAAKVADRTLGNPLFAVQLVGDWVQRGLLELSPRGFDLPKGADLRLPDELHDVWTSQVEQVVRGARPGARVALELAATLGQEVAFLEWRAACALAIDDVTGLDELVDAMVRARLAQRSTDGAAWSFSHGALRESLERAAREGGRARRHHRNIADSLVRLYGTEASGVSGRVGAHLVRADEHEAALEPLLFSARERIARSEWLKARRVLDLHHEALSALEVAGDDVRAAESVLLRARAELELGGDLDDAARAAKAVQGRGRLQEWQRFQPEAWLFGAYVNYRRGALADAARAFRHARRWAKRVGDEGVELRALFGLGDVEYYSGDRRSAGKRYRAALPIADRRGDVSLTVRALWSLGYVQLWEGQLARARRLFERQLELCRRESDQHGVARALSSIADVHRLSKEYDLAERLLREARDILERLGAVRSLAILEVNLHSVHIAGGKLASARVELEALLPRLVHLGEVPILAVAHALLAACAAAARDEDGAIHHIGEVESIVAQLSYVEGDVAEALERAGLLALDRGIENVARRAFQGAKEHWLRIGRDDLAAAIDRRLADPRRARPR